MNNPFQTLSTKIAWSCPWYAIRQDEIVLPNGDTGVYNTVTKRPAVWILPVTAAGEIVLCRIYRHTVDDWCWEIPAGSVKPGQSIEAAAREELLEEVGGTAASLDYLGQAYMANGICNEVGHFFLATDVSLGQPHHEPAEVIEVHLKPLAEVYDMVRRNEITDAPSALVLYMCEARLRQMM
jgi:8-oxo-dGTP pyrophosphatase MutT (NUDIX family)